MSEKMSRIIDLSEHGDERGKMVVIDGKDKIIPFTMKRIFYSYATASDGIRGKHANRNSEFVIVCMNGECKVLVKDGKKNEQEYFLSNPAKGLYIPKMLWKEMYDFSPDCVLMCIASEYYDADEYIYDYDEYLEVMDGEKI